jgi:sterol desaturase/sphingolipid hydroxylase (fatty acid hydroxylase superfamily)|eukprot:COSAG06_NODE_400_length_16205_cov_13.911275_6_plen_272_part_00
MGGADGLPANGTASLLPPECEGRASFSDGWRWQPCSPPAPVAALSAVQMAAIHIVAYIVVFSAAELALTGSSWGRAVWAPSKLNPKPSSAATVRRERRRTLIAGLIDAGYASVITSQATFYQIPDSLVGLGQLVLVLAAVFVWSDVHFFLTHRLLHCQPLYRWIHSAHHESVNPGPWSSLSFHPVEAAMFFSVYTLPVLCGLPWGVWVSFKLGSVLGPLHAHCGHDLGEKLHGSVFHYRHHRYKRGNYGGYLPFDRWCGTELGGDGRPLVA